MGEMTKRLCGGAAERLSVYDIFLLTENYHVVQGITLLQTQDLKDARSFAPLLIQKPRPLVRAHKLFAVAQALESWTLRTNQV